MIVLIYVPLVWLAAVHPRTRTPVRATALVAAIVLGLALFFPLVRLANLTSALLLIVFALVNLSLVVIQRRAPDPGAGFRVPRWVPFSGFASCAGFLALAVWNAL